MPVGLYAAAAPDHARFIGKCDGLAKPEDTYGVMVLGGAGAKAAPAIEILDPLCPACKAFEQRLDASGLATARSQGVLFPLDNTCNWMITETTHPGACTVSEAVLCAGDKARARPTRCSSGRSRSRTIRQAAEKLRTLPRPRRSSGSPSSPRASARRTRGRGSTSRCAGRCSTIPVLTPQLYVDSVKLCDEDVNMGLEYALGHMLDKHAAGTRR